MSAESIYLDALEALEADDKAKAAELAEQVLAQEPEHEGAWVLLSDSLMPAPRQQLDLAQTAKALSATRSAVKFNPQRGDLWHRGSYLLRSLGMIEQALAWWQEARHHSPYDATPIVEQATLLADMGLYAEAGDRLESIIRENMDVGASQNARIVQLLKTVKKAADQPQNTHFRPWEKNHLGWELIRLRMNKPPVSETMTFLVTTMPMLLLLIYFTNGLSSEGWVGFCMVSTMIFVTVMIGQSWAHRLHNRINRPALNLIRAMDLEASTGKVMIPENIRLSKLYISILGRSPKGYQERMIKIVDRKKALPSNYRPNLPDFESHLDEIGFFEDQDEEEDGTTVLSGFEEE